MTITDNQLHRRDDACAERSIATEPGGGRAWWFLGTLAVLRNPDGAPRSPTVIELMIPPGGSPPCHIHGNLDDSFFLLDGEVVVRCGERTIVARAGSYVVLPAGVKHTFRVTSAKPARMLLIHAAADFLCFVRPAESGEIVLTGPGRISCRDRRRWQGPDHWRLGVCRPPCHECAAGARFSDSLHMPEATM